MSALYMSKVAPKGSNRSFLQQAQDQSDSGKRVKGTKMAEDLRQRTDDCPPPTLERHHHGPVDICEAHSKKSIPPHLSKEELYEQRQKCELRRLLKHTHPELKMLDEVVDEELAEVLGSEIGATADETGYEGEVLSRRLLFENCTLSNKVSPYAHKMQMAERMSERGDVSKTPAVFEEHGVNKSDQGLKGGHPVSEPNQDTEQENEEELVKIDVRAARMKFENQAVVSTSKHQIKKHHGKVLAPEHDTKGIRKQEQDSKMCCKSSQYIQNKTNKTIVDIGKTIKEDFSSTKPISSGENSFDDDLDTPDLDKPEKVIKTSAALFKNNPFIPTNIDRECSFVNTPKYESQTGDSVIDQNYQMANVKNKTHVFESMPFHKIRQQNQDEIETMVENIKETLESLHKVNVIHSGGSIIEVNETMLAKKAKFTLSDEGPEISYDEVAEGGAQNLILQLLPRSNLKPQIIYLKEGSNKVMEATMVNVPVSQDTELKSANVVQVVEDILNQDNSLRKGVIFMEDGGRCAEVIVYSLYNYFDPKDVKSYSPAHDSEHETQETVRELHKTDHQEQPQTGFVKSTISSLLQTSKEQTCHELGRPEIEVKGNVKLFMSCIEKGDLEYLKTLQANPALEEEGVPQSQRMDGQEIELNCQQGDTQEQESTSEWVPVDVKRLKNIFSGDGRPVQPKQSEYLYKSHVQSTTVSHSSQNMPVEKSQSSPECSAGISPQVQNTFEGGNTQTQGEACDPSTGPQGSHLQLVAQDGDTVLRAELVQALDDNDEISDLKVAIYSLQQATLEAKSLQEKQKLQGQDSSKELLVSASCAKLLAMEKKRDEGDRPCPEQRLNELPSISSDNRLDASHCIQKETFGQESKEGVQNQLIRDMEMSECSETNLSQQDDHEVIFQGKLKAALDSLGKSNINVTRGDFREAMIYKSSSKPCNQKSQLGKEVSVAFIDQRSTQEPMKQEQQITIAQRTEEVVLDQRLREAPLCSYSSDMNSSQQDEEEVVFEGKLQAALDSLSRSNVNVTRGDFKAAMVYRGSSKPCNQHPQSANELSLTDPKPTQEQLKQDVCKKQVAQENMVPLKQSETSNKSSTSHALEKDKMLVSPITAILPEPRLNEFSLPVSIFSEDISELSLKNTEICQRDSNSKEKQTAVAQESKEVVKQNLQEALMSAECSEPMSQQQVDEEVVFQGKLQAALDSLGRSNINVSRGDFRTAMIYRNSSKPCKEQTQSCDTLLVQKTNNEGLPILTEAQPTQKPLKQDVPIRQMTAESLEPENQSKTPNKPFISYVFESGRGPACPKPAIPPKPEHLKSKQKNVQPTSTTNPDTTQTNTTGSQETDHTALAITPASYKNSQQMVQVNKAGTKVEGSDIALEKDETCKNIINQKQEINTSMEREGEKPHNLQNKESMGETDESPVDFHGACIKFESTKDISVKCAPIKPKRVKVAKLANKTPKEVSNDNSSPKTAQVDKEPGQNQTNEIEGKVEMREKKGRTETENERRERLSVHMDEIMRGNITAAMEIFDNLRKQEELKSILCQVEEIEQDKSEVDMSAMRKVFQDVPDWVVCSKKKNLEKEEGKIEEERLQPISENKSSVAHVFGNLERASEEIIILKEQTLGRLMDIEETIKKALYSVSTLKSDSDIAGLSSLFKESLGTVPGSPSSGNISKISIESSRTKSKQAQENPADVSQSTSVGASPAKQRTSPPSSPAFISIQSAARKTEKTDVPLQDTAICPACQHNPKTEEVFRTTKTLTCNSPAQNRKKRHGKRGKKQSSLEQHNPQQELCQPNVQTNSDGIIGTKTVTENFERTDNFGNRFYSSKTSTVVTTQPETTTSTGVVVATPATYQVATHPEVWLPINQKP